MNGDRSNHQGRVKVAEKAALPPACGKPLAFRRRGPPFLHAGRLEG